MRCWFSGYWNHDAWNAPSGENQGSTRIVAREVSIFSPACPRYVTFIKPYTVLTFPTTQQPEKRPPQPMPLRGYVKHLSAANRLTHSGYHHQTIRTESRAQCRELAREITHGAGARHPAGAPYYVQTDKHMTTTAEDTSQILPRASPVEPPPNHSTIYSRLSSNASMASQRRYLMNVYSFRA